MVTREKKPAGTEINGNKSEDGLWRSMKRYLGHGSETAL